MLIELHIELHTGLDPMVHKSQQLRRVHSFASIEDGACRQVNLRSVAQRIVCSGSVQEKGIIQCSVDQEIDTFFNFRRFVVYRILLSDALNIERMLEDL